MTASASTNRVCPFDGPGADSPRIASIAELLGAMEAAPLREPRVLVVRCIDRRRRVHVAIPKVEAFWTADQARTAADTLDAEQAFPGAAGVAAAIRAAADAADRRNHADGPLNPGRTPERTFVPLGPVARRILAALILTACLAAAWALDTLTNGAAL